MTLSIRERVAPRVRPWSMAVLLWAFGLCTTILLVGLWGRTVASDSHTLTDATRAVLQSGLVNQRIEDWVVEGMTEAESMAPGDLGAALDAASSTPRFRGAVDRLVDEAVTAALAPPGSGAAVDLSATVDGALPPMLDALQEHGIVTDEESMRAAALEASDLVLSSDEEGIVARAAADAGGLLTRVVLVCLATLLLIGGAVVAMSEDRPRQLKSLAIRVAVSAFTFSIFLRVGSWAVDPRGGRSPVAAGTSALLRSSIHVPVLVGLLAALVGLAAHSLRKRRHPPPEADAPPNGTAQPDRIPTTVDTTSVR